jgi:hypothetical protein
MARNRKNLRAVKVPPVGPVYLAPAGWDPFDLKMAAMRAAYIMDAANDTLTGDEVLTKRHGYEVGVYFWTDVMREHATVLLRAVQELKDADGGLDIEPGQTDEAIAALTTEEA